MRLWSQNNPEYEYEFILSIGRDYHTIELKGDYTKKDTGDY